MNVSLLCAGVPSSAHVEALLQPFKALLPPASIAEAQAARRRRAASRHLAYETLTGMGS